MFAHSLLLKYIPQTTPMILDAFAHAPMPTLQTAFQPSSQRLPACAPMGAQGGHLYCIDIMAIDY